MAIGDKPADLPEWASGGSAQIEEPSEAKKDLGWVKEKPPFKWFNWFWNLVYQWVAFVQNYSANHVHDGGVTDLSAPLVDLNAHIDYGTNGDLAIGTDDASLHEVIHDHSGAGTALLRTDFSNPSVLRLGHTTGQQIDVDDASGIADARELRVASPDGDDAGLSADALKPNLSVPPGGNFDALFPPDQAIYARGIVKALCRAELVWNGSTWTATIQDQLNVAAVTVGASFVDITFTADANIHPTVVGNVSTLASRIYIGNVQPLVGGPKTARIVPLRYNAAPGAAGNQFDNAISSPVGGEIFTICVAVY